ncbi:MAG: hypothetical protein DDT29_01531 [Dehalococcoidia bacterium]|nr:hypothetical protein [Bacillota bacterium]
MGVGTTAAAAILHDRHAAGAEISHDYMEVGRNRVMLASERRLPIRPMDRPIYDPNLPGGGQEPYTRVDTVTLRLFGAEAPSCRSSQGEESEKSL